MKKVFLTFVLLFAVVSISYSKEFEEFTDCAQYAWDAGSQVEDAGADASFVYEVTNAAYEACTTGGSFFLFIYVQ